MYDKKKINTMLVITNLGHYNYVKKIAQSTVIIKCFSDIITHLEMLFRNLLHLGCLIIDHIQLIKIYILRIKVTKDYFKCQT